MNQAPNLRILFVNRMAGMVRGGGETFDLEISNELVRMGCDVTFLTGKPLFGNPKPAPTDTSILPADRIKTIRSPYLPWFPWDKVRGGWRVRVWEFRQFEKKAARWINQHANEFDVIQICELPYLVSLLKGVKIQEARSQVVEKAGSSTKHQAPSTPAPETACGSHGAGQARIPPIVLRLTAPNAHDPWGGIQAADAVIASGTSIAKVRKALRPDVHDVPNGVDLERFQGDKGAREQGQGSQASEVRNQREDGGDRHGHPGYPVSGIRATHGIPSGAPVLLYVARFQAFKNHRLMMDAFASVLQVYPEARLVLVGSGPLMRELEVRCQRSDVRGRVIFLGEVPFDHLPSIYRDVDVKVISSEYESFCFAAIEAMASGLPVVTTDCGWVPKLLGDALAPIEKQWSHGGDAPGRFEVEEDGKRIRHAPGGLVVSRAEPHSLASALLRMIADKNLQASCGAWNREKAVREHGWESSARKLLEVYQRLMNRT